MRGSGEGPLLEHGGPIQAEECWGSLCKVMEVPIQVGGGVGVALGPTLGRRGPHSGWGVAGEL